MNARDFSGNLSSGPPGRISLISRSVIKPPLKLVRCLPPSIAQLLSQNSRVKISSVRFNVSRRDAFRDAERSSFVNRRHSSEAGIEIEIAPGTRALEERLYLERNKGEMARRNAFYLNEPGAFVQLAFSLRLACSSSTGRAALLVHGPLTFHSRSQSVRCLYPVNSLEIAQRRINLFPGRIGDPDERHGTGESVVRKKPDEDYCQGRVNPPEVFCNYGELGAIACESPCLPSAV